MKVFISPNSNLNVPSADLQLIGKPFYDSVLERLRVENTDKTVWRAPEQHVNYHSILLLLDDDEFSTFTHELGNIRILQGQEAFEDPDLKWLTELKDFIRTHLEASNLSSVQICKHFGLSRSSLYRKLKKSMDKSVTEFIREVRLEVASEYLKTKECSIAEIAYKVGFSSPSHFTRVFKKNYGQTPSDALCSFSQPQTKVILG
jgi:AraC-like DNA-binding protein